MDDSSVTIPQELVNEIIGIIASGLRQDTKTLSTCSLVARGWMYTCRKYMFRHMGISRVSEAGTRRLTESLLSSPHETISPYIESVSLEVYPKGYVTTAFISALAAKAVHPSQLKVTFLNDAQGSSIDQLGMGVLVSQWAGRATSLELSLEDVRKDNGEPAFGALLTAFTNISALTLRLPGIHRAHVMSFAQTDELSRKLTSFTSQMPTQVDAALISWMLAQPLKLTRLTLSHHNEHIRLISGHSRRLSHLDIMVGGGIPPINRVYPPLPVLNSLILRLYLSELPRAIDILQSLRVNLASISELELQVLSTTLTRKASMEWVQLRPVIEALPTLNTVHFRLRAVQSPKTMQTHRAILQELFESSAQRGLLIISYMMSRPIPVFETA